ncbi:MAG: glycogen/starch synthase [Candidatus Izemoplasmataceae bacterium]
MNNTMLAIIDATAKAQLDRLTIHRMPGALPFAGKYRLIDFALSNIKNANITNVAIFPYGNYRSLQDHIGSGKRWDLDRRKDGLFILPPKNMTFATEDMVTFQRMSEHIEYFKRSLQPYVLLIQAHIVWNIDFSHVLDDHITSGADITEIMGEKTRLKSFIIAKDKLLNYILEYDAIPYKTINDVVLNAPSIKINTYIHKAYTRYITDNFNYMKSNLDMLRFDIGRTIFSSDRPILSKEKTAPPTFYDEHAKVSNSMIASGTYVNGTVRNSIIGRDVIIKESAVIDNSVIMSNAVIESNTFINYAILDKGTIVKEDTYIEGTSVEPYVTQKEQIVTPQTDFHVLHVASEALPFVKTGGLADVIGSLSRHLAKKGIKTSVILPLYKKIKENYEDAYEKKISKVITFGDTSHKIRLFHMIYKQVNYYFIESFHYFERTDIYGYDDDCERFAFFNLAVSKVLEAIEPVDLVHLHDWHVGLIPTILSQQNIKKKPKTLLTLHNIDYQGVCQNTCMNQLHLNQHYNPERFTNFLETAILTVDKLTTVSPTYRDELRYDYYGKNLTQVLLKRERDFYGILNGISSKNSPQNDSLIHTKYHMQNLEKKVENKRFLQKEMQLEINDAYFVIGIVSRIAEQKGFDIMIPALDEFLSDHHDCQVVLLGTGSKEYVMRLTDLATKYPKQVKLNIGYDATIPNYIYAGADLFLMPSRVEPCGLSQMIAMRYGTIPLVRHTGGLADTVTNYDAITKQGHGFSFFPYDVSSLKQTLHEAKKVFNEEPITWKKMMKRSMRQDFSLERQATKMIELYRMMLEN